MSRGGRGGGRGRGGMRGGMRGNPLPFEVDPDLVDNAEGAVTDASDENKAKQLFPPIDLVIPHPLTSKDRELVAISRELKAKREKSVWWTGTREQNGIGTGAKGTGKRVADAFDSMETYSKKKRAKPDAFVPLAKRKFPRINPDWTPAELIPGNNTTNTKQTKRKGSSTASTGKKPSASNRLTTLDDVKDDDAGADDESVDGATAAAAGKPAGDDDAASDAPQDSEFEEDEADDADNDYNAENYFSGGEGDDGSAGEGEGEEGDASDDGEDVKCVKALYFRGFDAGLDGR